MKISHLVQYILIMRQLVIKKIFSPRQKSAVRLSALLQQIFAINKLKQVRPSSEIRWVILKNKKTRMTTSIKARLNKSEVE